jgi:hypothetical protein
MGHTIFQHAPRDLISKRILYAAAILLKIENNMKSMETTKPVFAERITQLVSKQASRHDTTGSVKNITHTTVVVE